MTVLLKAEIEHEIDTKNLISNADKGNIKGCSYDLTIGTIFSEGRIINANSPEATSPHIVPPGGVISILTREQINLPLDIMATAFPINTMSSKGFMVLNPGHVDPGFSGALSVKAVNLRKTGLALQLGTPVFTVIFERLHAETSRFERNRTHSDREREFNAQDIEVSPQTLSSLIQLDRSGPYPVRDEVNDLIRQHWMSRTSFWFTLIAAVASVIIIYLQLRDPSDSSYQRECVHDRFVGAVKFGDLDRSPHCAPEDQRKGNSTEEAPK